MKYSKTAVVDGWGSSRNARRVTRMTGDERAAVRAGEEVRIAGCPSYSGETDRIIVECGGRFYCRMPDYRDFAS